MRTIVLNRTDRPDRLVRAKEQLDSFGIEYEIFPAIVKERGWEGCRDSHLSILEKCVNTPMEQTFLVLEDDFLFLDDYYWIKYSMEQLPKTWDMLYLGISPRTPMKRISDNLMRVNSGYTTHAIVWNKRKDGAIEYILKHRLEIMKLDVFYNAVIHKQFGCYAIYPMLVTQWDDHSNTCRTTGVATIEKYYNQFSK